jgi:hypothetical protein
MVGGTPVTDEFTDFENFQFTDGTKTLEDLFGSVTFSFIGGASGATERISVDSSENQGNAASDSEISVSADGRYVVFSSTASNLVAGDTNGVSDVFVRDLVTGTTTRVAVDSSELESNGASVDAVISADGRYVAFQSLASNLVAGDTNGFMDVFVRDLLSGTTTRVSVDSAGTEASGATSANVSISADGRYVTFHSDASNLVANDTNGTGDVFVRDVVAGTTARVSVNSAGVEGNSISGNGSISHDGRYVVFGSIASNLAAGDTANTGDFFIRDLVAGTTSRIPIGTNGLPSGGGGSPIISGNGRYVLFDSNSSNLVASDTNNDYDVFVRDLVTNTINRVSVSSANVQANGNSFLGSISADGRYVIFSSTASNLVSGDTNGLVDIFMRDLLTGVTTRLSMDTAGGQSNNSSWLPAISADGSYIAYVSLASDLVSGDTNAAEDIFGAALPFQWNEIALDVTFSGLGADEFQIDWGDNETTTHSLWGGPELRVRHDYAANISGTGTIRAMNEGTEIAASTFSVQTAPAGTSGSTLTGGAGVDILIGHDGPDTLNGLDGDDMLAGGAGADTLNGGLGNDMLNGGVGNDTLNGEAGNDMLNGGVGNDTLNGGAGNDIYYVDSLSDAVSELLNDGTDEVRTTTSSYTLSANVENLTYIGASTFTGTGNDLGNVITGGSGDDTLIGGAGADTLIGGAGTTDWASYSTSSTGITLDFLTGAHTGDAAGDVFDGIEGVMGTSFADTFYAGGAVRNYWGGAGADYFYASAGEDDIDGGDGIDTVFYSNSTAGVTISMAWGVNTGGYAADDNIGSVENVYGSSYADSITGNNDANSLFGQDGDDVLDGYGGNDRLDGNAGNDTLTGGDGNDRFVFKTSFGHDTLTDFAAGGSSVDIIEIHDDLFADFAAVQAASQQVGSDVVITYDAYNSITLQNVNLINLHQVDFLFV